jgi:hypothetical protein
VTPQKPRSCDKFLWRTQEKKEILRNPVRNGFLDPKNKFLKTGICNLGGHKEGENMYDEVLFRRRESIPIFSVGCKVNLEASAFLYILQMSLCWMGKRTKRWGFAWRSGLAASSPVVLAVLWCKALRRDDGGDLMAFYMVEGQAALWKNLSQSSPLSP